MLGPLPGQRLLSGVSRALYLLSSSAMRARIAEDLDRLALRDLLPVALGGHRGLELLAPRPGRDECSGRGEACAGAPERRSVPGS